MGNDGVIYKNVKDVGEGIYNFDEDEIIKFWEDYETQGYGVVYSVINPNQIKSATDNTGTYSKENDDIRLRKIKEDNELFLENGYSENWIKNATEEEKEVAKYCIGI